MITKFPFWSTDLQYDPVEVVLWFVDFVDFVDFVLVDVVSETCLVIREVKFRAICEITGMFCFLRHKKN